MIAIVDYGLGNLGSVTKGFRHAGAETVLTGDPEVLARADALVLPGDGAFGATMAEIRGRGLDLSLREAAARGTPLLGICIGMQVLFEESEEHGRHEGLGLLPGRVRRFDGALPVPHMGWNRLAFPGAPPALRRHSRRQSRVLRALVLLRRSIGRDPRHLRLRSGVSRGGEPGQRARRAIPSREEPGHRPRDARQLREAHRGPAAAEDRVIVVPAIDIRHGRVVRLKQGRLADETVYGVAPTLVARTWEAEGARRIHLVDLDAAIESRPQREVIAEVIAAVKVPVEVGGGLRVLENAMRYRQNGADRVIFGTAAVARPGVVQEAVRLWPEAVAVAIDAKNGMVTVAGWNEVSTVKALDLAATVAEWGVRRIQYTDVVRDGSLVGPNFKGIEEIAKASGLKVSAGGGIATIGDLERMRELEALGVDEVIVGKALYDKRFTLAQAMAAAG